MILTECTFIILFLCTCFLKGFFGFKRIYKYIWSEVKLVSIVEGDPKILFSIATTPRCGRRALLSLDYSTLPYLIMLSVRQGGIKYHFFFTRPGTEPRSPRPPLSQYIYISKYSSYLPNPSARAGYDTRSTF